MAIASGAGVNPGVNRFVPLFGSWRASPEATGWVVYYAPSESSSQDDVSPSAGLTLTDFEGRVIDFGVTIRFEASQWPVVERSGITAGIVVGFRNVNAPYGIIQIGAYNRQYAISRWQPGAGWQGTLVSPVDVSVLGNFQDHDLTIKLSGQHLRVWLDQTPIIEYSFVEPLPGNSVGLFGFGNQRIRFSNFVAARQTPKAFVAIPFQPPFTVMTDLIVRPAAADAGFEAQTVAMVYGPGNILDDIVRLIEESEVIIADLSTRNPNVLYELGFARGRGKPSILLAQSGTELPFDVRPYRTLFYDPAWADNDKLRDSLTKGLAALKADRL